MPDGERFNVITHFIGSVAALIGVTLLVIVAARHGDPWKIVSCAIYGSTLLFLYLSSTLYHHAAGSAKNFLRKFDHNAIYLLIAGSYTPITLVTLRGSWGWSLFAAVWVLAILGIVLEFYPLKGPRILPVIIHLLMGWLVIFALKPLLLVLPRSGFLWLLAGGIFYTGGVLFYALDSKVRHFHGIWHLFVLAGSICHYFLVLLYIA
ncbi:MAG: hemolysin III [Desulfuromonadales bacterium GWD2_61_12]|nr:MAG: hemolysin III [Desulfuromonadales bacterium GWC2_61_20]OGR34041.1 MAG: hemolysin III [Desulfuromonadales bacterium GWD2_61_12]HAD03837.1 hemolysin III [Desulfuromonas sp.]HBT83679.1 hemolysin III [Desulfuromonas sp.]